MAEYQPTVDDIFDDDVEENYIAEKEWNRTENDIKKAGYRLGLSAGQEETLQQGFDTGYARAAEASFCLGKVKGEISAYLQISEDPAGVGMGVGQAKAEEEGQQETGTAAARLRELLEVCTRFEQSLMQQLLKRELSGVPVSAVIASHPPLHPPASLLHHHPTTAATMHTDSVPLDGGLQDPRTGGGMGMGDVADLMNVMSVQELAPVSLAAFLQQVQESLLQIVSPPAAVFQE